MNSAIQRTAARGFRNTLLGSVAAVGLAFAAGSAQAQSGVIDPDGAERAAQGASTGVIDTGVVSRDPQIVIGAPGTPTTARDPVNITGVAQMVVDAGGGFIGLCTATLINPRTVIFAAHCVNDDPANSYGANSGGRAIGFGFEANTRANATGQTDELVRWLLGGTGGAGKYQTNLAQSFFNANYVAYNPLSLEPDAAQFIYGDVALASLDTPAKGIPTWALLFSQLPQVPITANGTGYHVNITGYGNNGTGSTGSTGGIDYRRRIAENMLGALASIDDFENFLFGGTSGLPQNLYWIDFDDPRRGTAQADPRDFNAWRDNPQPNEGITASGDSGGPLILDKAFAKQLVIGVLSGGYTRFFGGAPANGYGTASFYQPLYLYWDWIAANNPYHYVTNVAGSRNWTDAANWVTTLDPSYNVIVGGQVVNGIPNDPGQQKSGTSGKFGQACFEGPANGGFSDCQDMQTGTYTVTVRPIGTDLTDGSAMVGIGSLTGELSNDAAKVAFGVGDLSYAAVASDATAAVGGASPQTLPSATLANGLPGAINFVPNNFDGNRTANQAPRYFDVTLSAAGTTTLDTAVTVDRFTLAGTQAGLSIATAGALTSLMDITQATGTMTVNGALNTPGDYLMMTGLLTGSGTVTSAFFTSMAGTISPGTTGTIGTLNFRGNIVLASGTGLMIDLGPNGTSDRIAVAANGTGTGNANIGGVVAFGAAAGTSLRYQDIFTILTTAGTRTGTFSAGSTLSAILVPRFIYTSNSVQMQIDALTYASVVANTPVQTAYAGLLDANRAGSYSKLAGVYGPLDLMTAASIRTTLEGLAPQTETLKGALGSAAVDNMANFISERLSTLEGSDMGGTVAVIGKPLQLASLNLGAAGALGMETTATDMAQDMTVQEGALPETMSAFFAGGYLTGNSASMAGAINTGSDDFDGWFLAAGIETQVDDAQTLGFSLSYSKLDGTVGGVNQSASGALYQGTIYGKLQSGPLKFSTLFSAGLFDVSSLRNVAIGASSFALRSSDQALALTSEVKLGYAVVDTAVKVVPTAALRTTQIGFSDTVESGGGPALRVQRQSSTSVEGRLGLSVSGNSAGFRPFVNANYVHDFANSPTAFFAGFEGGVGPEGLFALTGNDNDWFEVGGGLSAGGENFRVSVSANTTIDRNDIETQSYRASVSFSF